MSSSTSSSKPLFSVGTGAESRISDEVSSAESFSQCYSDRIPSWLLARTEALGFMSPTPVQKLALDEIFQRSDVVIQAQTG